MFRCLLRPRPFRRRFGRYSVVTFSSGTRNYLTRSCCPHSARLGEGRRPQVWALPRHLPSFLPGGYHALRGHRSSGQERPGGRGHGHRPRCSSHLHCDPPATLHPGPSWASVNGDRSGRPPQPGAPSPPRLARCYLRSSPPTLAWSANRRGPDRVCRCEMDCLG